MIKIFARDGYTYRTEEIIIEGETLSFKISDGTPFHLYVGDIERIFWG